MTNDHPPPDTPKILEVLEPFVDFCECQMRFGANDFAHRHDPPRGHGLHDNLVRRDYKISVFKKRIGIRRSPRGRLENFKAAHVGTPYACAHACRRAQSRTKGAYPWNHGNAPT